MSDETSLLMFEDQLILLTPEVCLQRREEHQRMAALWEAMYESLKRFKPPAKSLPTPKQSPSVESSEPVPIEQPPTLPQEVPPVNHRLKCTKEEIDKRYERLSQVLRNAGADGLTVAQLLKDDLIGFGSRAHLNTALNTLNLKIVPGTYPRKHCLPEFTPQTDSIPETRLTPKEVGLFKEEPSHPLLRPSKPYYPELAESAAVGVSLDRGRTSREGIEEATLQIKKYLESKVGGATLAEIHQAVQSIAETTALSILNRDRSFERIPQTKPTRFRLVSSQGA